MTAPWTLFLAVGLGLIAGGGVEAIQAPVRLWTSAIAAPLIIEAQACVVGRLING